MDIAACQASSLKNAIAAEKMKLKRAIRTPEEKAATNFITIGIPVTGSGIRDPI
jgi:hypothetical protein